MAPAGRMRKSPMPSGAMSKPPTMFANALRRAGDSRFPWSASPKVDRLTCGKLDGQGEARLIALACSDPPEGFSQWTLQLLADELVELQIVESISIETVRQTLKKTPYVRIGGPTG